MKRVTKLDLESFIQREALLCGINLIVFFLTFEK